MTHPAEARLAREQYQELMKYVRSEPVSHPGCQRDRRAEMVPLKHGRAEQMYSGWRIFKFWPVRSSRRLQPGLLARMEMARRHRISLALPTSGRR